jgi:site-specific recombinase XerD
MTLYATGARRAEAAHLKVGDIDSQRMVVHIRGGKGAKDRPLIMRDLPVHDSFLSFEYLHAMDQQRHCRFCFLLARVLVCESSA